MITEVLIYLAVLATAPIMGLLLARLCDDELVMFRKYILVTVYSLVIAGVLFAVFYFTISILMSIIYMLIVFSTILIKSYKQRI